MAYAYFTGNSSFTGPSGTFPLRTVHITEQLDPAGKVQMTLSDDNGAELVIDFTPTMLRFLLEALIVSHPAARWGMGDLP